MERPGLVLSCEHGGCEVPRPWRALLAGHPRLLASHRGWDRGARELALRLSCELETPLLVATVTRLLVDANRSEGNPEVFSRYTRGLPEADRARLLAEHHRPHWRAVEAAVREALVARRGPVLHLSVHSFTPVHRGTVRRTDLGILYDPRRAGERAVCRRWQRRLSALRPGLVVRRNDPYRGDADGLTTHLRRALGEPRYLGVELEVNQRWVRRGGSAWSGLQEVVVRSLREVLERLAG